MVSQEPVLSIAEQWELPKWKFMKRQGYIAYLKRIFLASTIKLVPLEPVATTRDVLHRYFLSIAMSLHQYNEGRKAEGKPRVTVDLFHSNPKPAESPPVDTGNPPAILPLPE